jgi:heme-degrading monooxygenase HmoA
MLYELPYYAVIFTTTMSKDAEGYEEMADAMSTLASQQPGYLGHESARNDLGITVSYWTDEFAIKAWKEKKAHFLAQQKGKAKWYASYTIRVCKVERQYDFDSNL